MSWPLSQDYNEAIQSPATNFADADLKKSEVVANALGLPKTFFQRSRAGAFPTSPAPAAPEPAAQAVPEGMTAPSEQQGTLSALELFLRDPAPSFDWSTLTDAAADANNLVGTPPIERHNPTAPKNERAAYLAAIGAGLYISGREKRRNSRNSSGRADQE
jgi:hypothetical protein